MLWYTCLFLSRGARSAHGKLVPLELAVNFEKWCCSSLLCCRDQKPDWTCMRYPRICSQISTKLSVDSPIMWHWFAAPYIQVILKWTTHSDMVFRHARTVGVHIAKSFPLQLMRRRSCDLLATSQPRSPFWAAERCDSFDMP